MPNKGRGKCWYKLECRTVIPLASEVSLLRLMRPFVQHNLRSWYGIIGLTRLKWGIDLTGF